MSFGAKNILGMVHTVATGYDKSSSKIKIGYITAYDPKRYAVRVRIEPESYANEQAGVPNPVVETNWIPVYRPFGGDTWGFKSPPNADPSPPYGDQAVILFPDGGHGVAFVGFYNKVEKAYTSRKIGDPNDATDPQPAAGEWQYVHKTGSFIKFRNDGTVMIFGKPQGLSGFPGSALLYLTDDGEVELRDSENNFLKMYAKHQNIRVEMTDVEGNFIRLQGTQATRINIRDAIGNNILLRGDSADSLYEVNVTGGHNIRMGPNLGSGVKVHVRDGSNNRLQLFGADQGLRIHLASVDGHYIQMRTDASFGLGTPSGVSKIEMTAGTVTIQAANTAGSGIVTLNHLINVVAQINATFATKQNGSGSAGAVVAEASTKVIASD